MPNEEAWKSLLSQQKIITEDLEKEISKLKSEDIVVENEALHKQLSNCEAQLAEANKQLSLLAEENMRLKSSLYEQIYNEKIAILKAVTKKTDVYYQNSMEGEMNRLKEFELESLRRINSMSNTLKEYRVNSQDEIYDRINELRQLLEDKLAQAKRILADQSSSYAKYRDDQYQRLQGEGLSEEEMKRAVKRNNMEALIGLNILNKIGIFLLIVGVIALTQFTYLQLADMMKSVFVFLGGSLLLILGELLNRKKPNVFSIGLTGGGVAVLFIAIAVSYFGLRTISMYPALMICVMITALSFYLSQRYQSQTIAAFSLVGGYLPILAIGTRDTLLYSAMAYFIILNLLSLFISSRRKWSITAFIGFAFNILTTAYIMQLMLTMLRDQPTNHWVKNSILVLYIFIAFLIYSLIPIAGSYYSKKKMSIADVVLLSLNTYISAIFIYTAFFMTAFTDFKGTLALIFAVSYYLLSKLMSRRLPAEKRIRALFSITSFVFVVLIVPLQFNTVWLSLGWLIEGVMLICYGILKEDRRLRKYGYIVTSLCVIAFYIFDFIPKTFGRDYHFTSKYLSITLGLLVIIGTYFYKRTLASKIVNVLKYVCYVNLWIFMLYLIWAELSEALYPLFQKSNLDMYYLLHITGIAISFLLASIIPRIRQLSDWGMKLISGIIYGVSILWLGVVDTVASPAVAGTITMEISIYATLILIVINLLSLLAMMDLMKWLIKDRRLGSEWYSLILSIYLVAILTQNLLTQYKVELTSFMISILYILLSLFWIVGGFIKRYSFLRRFGLGLSFLAMAKLFLMDLAFLTEGYRIISYFAFGMILLAISFIYQYFSKRLENQSGFMDNKMKTE